MAKYIDHVMKYGYNNDIYEYNEKDKLLLTTDFNILDQIVNQPIFLALQEDYSEK